MRQSRVLHLHQVRALLLEEVDSPVHPIVSLVEATK